MKSNSRGLGFLFLVVLVLVLFALILASAVTDSETVKNYRDDIRDKADKLKQDILSQENVVNRIRTELSHIRNVQGYLVKKANRLCIAVKCIGLIIVAGLVVMVHSIFSLNPVEFLLSFCAMITLVYGTVTGIILNEVRGINDALKLLQEAIIRKTYLWYNFQPDIVEFLEQKLLVEEQKLVLLRVEYDKALNKRIDI